MDFATGFQINQDLSLLDEEFLIALSEQKQRELYARVIALDVNELPVEEISGRVTGGNINVDGDSAVRRTCSLTMLVEDVSVSEFYWGLKTKIALYIGIKNRVIDEQYSKYPDMIWFPQGIYVLTSFNTSLQTNGCTISLQGKDKMCLLNGDVGGQLFASVDFGTEEIVNKIFKKADIFQTSSDLLMDKQFFIDDFDLSDLDAIDENDAKYAFEKNAAGQYYKDRSTFRKIPQNENNENNTSPDYHKSERYKIYQMIQSPSELFTEANITSTDYVAGMYYYQKAPASGQDASLGVYIIDNTTTYDGSKTYYSLKQLYTVDYETTIHKIPIERIIRESVHAYALEPYHNIIINDLDSYGLEQLTYQGEKPIYALRDGDTGHFTQLVLGGTNVSLDTLVASWTDEKFDQLSEDLLAAEPQKIKINNGSFEETADITNFFTVAKIEAGEDIGYRVTDLTYTGDLISGVGESLTSVLDKIKAMLGDFEYFYDLEGHFVFQRKKIFVNTSWSQIAGKEDSADEQYVTFGYDQRKFSFNFEGNRLISAIQNSPVLTNLRNDYSVWGVRKGINGADIPIHARYAIDKKPKKYLAFNGTLYYTKDAEFESAVPDNGKLVDWRELIYQMAIDYFAGQGCSPEDPVTIYALIDSTPGFISLNTPDDFLYYVGLNNRDDYPTGYTGYEQYYTDMEGFWRQLYNPDFKPIPIYHSGTYEVVPQYFQGSNYYEKVKTWKAADPTYEVDYYLPSGQSEYAQAEQADTLGMFVGSNDSKLYWSREVFTSPETLNFWFDFLDSQSDLAQFSVSQLGVRSKAVNETKASAIIFKTVPDIILCPNRTRDDNNDSYYGWHCDTSSLRAQLQEETGYTFIFFPPGFAQYFSISYRSTSVKNKIDELLYKHAYCIENISITALPVYYLQPNTRIYVHDQTTKINGEYIVSKISLPLTYNGTMSITATKAPERLL